MNTMPESLIRGLGRIRQAIQAQAEEQLIYCFVMDEPYDVGQRNVGEVFEQNEDWWLFESMIDTSRRAGPSMVSPRRYYGSLDIALFTKGPKDSFLYGEMLEEKANWLQDRTVNGVRFRSYVPSSTVTMRGFTAYGGVIPFEFEVNMTER